MQKLQLSSTSHTGATVIVAVAVCAVQPWHKGTWQGLGLTDNIYSQLHDSCRHLQLDENI